MSNPWERLAADLTRLASDFTRAACKASGDVPAEELRELAERHDGEFFHSGGGIMLALVPLGTDHLAIVSGDALTLWETGPGRWGERYEVAYEKAAGEDAVAYLSAEAAGR